MPFWSWSQSYEEQEIRAINWFHAIGGFVPPSIVTLKISMGYLDAYFETAYLSVAQEAENENKSRLTVERDRMISFKTLSENHFKRILTSLVDTDIVPYHQL